MGKRRIANKKGGGIDQGRKSRQLSRVPKKKLDAGVLHIEATFNNTRMLLTDKKGNAFINASSGTLGFKGTKKGTPFAAAKVGELLGEKGSMIGLKEVDVVVKGVGQGRESALRAFANRGIAINSIKDRTPVPHNGPRPRKPRRV